MIDPTPSRRRPAGRTMWLTLGALVVVVVAGGWLAFRLLDPGPEGARDTVVALLEDWRRSDTEAIARLTRGPAPTVRSAYRDQAKALGGWPARVRLAHLVERGDRATAGFRATFRIADDASWTYRGTIGFVRTDAGWRARWTPANVHPRLTDVTHFRLTRAWEPRAPILAEDGTALTVDAAVVTVGIEPQRMKSPDATYAALQQYLGVDPADAAAAVNAPGVQPSYFVPIVTVPDAQYRAVKSQVYPVPGLLFRSSTRRVAATPQLAAHVVGTTGPITKELLDELGPPYDANATVGRSGLERAYEERLAGTPSRRVEITDEADVSPVTLRTFPGRTPEPVRTTIDLGTQQRAEAAVGTTAPAALVAVRPSDGAVRAVVSTPVAQEFDRALDGAYPPGSTFKVVTAAALLRNGVSLDTTATCPPTVTVDGREFRNFEGESAPSLPFLRAFAISCNTAFIGLAQQLPEDALGDAARTFGFDTDPRLGLAARRGSFPAPGSPTERAAAAIGQARVTASPVVMAGVAATVAAGTWHAPSLVSDPPTTDRAPDRPLEPAVAAALRTAMTQVVRDGTGTAAAIPGQAIAGKTGTAEFGDDVPPKTHAWFIGFRDDLAFAVLVEGGGVGGRVAAPIAHTFLAAG